MLTFDDLKNLSLEDVLKAIDKGDLTDMLVQTYPLDIAFSNFSIEISGNFIGCISATDSNVSASIEFNKVGSGSIPFSQGLYVGRPFNRLFLTSTAQTGKTISFLISSTSSKEFFVQDNRSTTVQASLLTTIAGELQGDSTFENIGTEKSISTVAIILAANTSRKACNIQAKHTNTDAVYIGFDNTVTATKWVAVLQPGDSILFDDYRGDIYGIAASGTQKIGFGEW